ncbi:right-handed parallel beta-helix repeat-containing protein [Aeoliella sp. ICT_H6.2]|uniref:Right-handed parallel beta-helix repeat-containing protein n=1 Tax=Aeoliella straminimaris TaxID=2954799 RepID=A0A9X2JE29_9BACT|nr:right-handed parallel beta-helix repeat-containing protein [Aeoliella straminimaris]MCO6042535.1 right-handed parallel beta-helix repeat-containing protein [Aeoliella straminimaris]
MKCWHISLIVLSALATNPAAAQIDSRGSIGHQFGEEPGYEAGYTRGGAFLPLLYDGNHTWLWYADLQYTLDNYGDDAGSVGLGARHFFEQRDLIAGVNAYWDGRDFQSDLIDHDVHQYGFGLELLGPVWSSRFNVYLDSNSPVSQPFSRVTGLNYQANNLAVTQQTGDLLLDSMQGGDFEVARRLRSLPVELGLGFYHLQAEGGDANHAWGPMGRVQGWLTPQLEAYAAIRNDRVFGTTTSTGLVWYFGGASPSGQSRCERMAVPVRRQYNVPVTTLEANVVNSTELARDSVSGNVLTFTHVQTGASGNGTAETPYGTLAAASNAGTDVVLVQPGLYVGDSIILSPGTRLLAASRSHSLSTQFGTLAMPLTGLGGVTEILYAPNPGAAIALANNTEVSGFTITDPFEGIVGANITGINLNHNVVNGASSRAIELLSVSGDIVNNSVTGGLVGLRISSFNGGTISNNIFSRNADGLIVATLNAGTISDNIANGNSGAGMFVQNMNGGQLTGNTANDNGGRGYSFSQVAGGSIADNTADGNTDSGFQIAQLTGGSFRGNVARNNLESGLFLGATTGTGTVSNNVFDGNGTNGMQLLQGLGGVISNNTSSGNDIGYELNFTAGSTTALTTNSATNNTTSGYSVTGTPGSGAGTNTGNANGSNDTY